MEFEVAEIRPSDPDTHERFEFQPGGRIHAQAVTLKSLIQLAWNIKGDDMLVGAPKWLDDARFDVLPQERPRQPRPTDKAGRRWISTRFG